MADESTARVLREAAAVLRRDGWCQHESEGANGSPCALGAMGPMSEARLQAREAVRVTIGKRSVSEWNDAPGRTAEEVIAVLESTAARLESGGAT